MKKILSIDRLLKNANVLLAGKDKNLSIPLCCDTKKKKKKIFFERKKFDNNKMNICFLRFCKFCSDQSFNTFMYDHTLNRERKHFCRNCLQAFTIKEISKRYIKDYFKINGKQKIIMLKNVNLLNPKIK